MRSILLTSFLLLVGFTAISQLTLTPQIGLERSKTTIELNDLNSFSPLGSQFSPQAGLRLDYKFKKGHGPFIGFGTSRSVVMFDFNNPETVLNSYRTVRDNIQLRLEGGYQLSTKPIYFKGSSSQRKTSLQKNTSSSPSQKGSCGDKMKQQAMTYRKSCGGNRSKSGEEYAAKPKTEQKSSGCGQKSTAAKQLLTKKNNPSYIRFQPLAGVAFIPSPKADGITTKTFVTQNTYSYNAGNWSTAAMAGLGFEFGRGKTKTFQVNIQYLRGIGNLDENELTTVAGNKTTKTTFSSETGIWNITAGIPISLSKKQTPKPSFQKEKSKQNCERTYKSCGGIRMKYRSL
jgi:hypothetical protein